MNFLRKISLPRRQILTGNSIYHSIWKSNCQTFNEGLLLLVNISSLSLEKQVVLCEKRTIYVLYRSVKHDYQWHHAKPLPADNFTKFNKKHTPIERSMLNSIYEKQTRQFFIKNSCFMQTNCLFHKYWVEHPIHQLTFILVFFLNPWGLRWWLTLLKFKVESFVKKIIPSSQMRNCLRALTTFVERIKLPPPPILRLSCASTHMDYHFHIQFIF